MSGIVVPLGFDQMALVQARVENRLWRLRFPDNVADAVDGYLLDRRVRAFRASRKPACPCPDWPGPHAHYGDGIAAVEG